jgi:hypothetical protein
VTLAESRNAIQIVHSLGSTRRMIGPASTSGNVTTRLLCES